jgi:predicted amidophosphoribosyltransferase
MRSPLLAPSITGDDGYGNCRGCGKPLERIDPSCPVCCAWLDYTEEEYDPLPEPSDGFDMRGSRLT